MTIKDEFRQAEKKDDEVGEFKAIVKAALVLLPKMSYIIPPRYEDGEAKSPLLYLLDKYFYG